MIKNLKEKLVSTMGSASGLTGILGSWQVCHNLCLGVVALMGIIGITVAGMPLLFFTKIAVPAWSLAVVLLAVTVWLYQKKHCISRNLLILNSGLIVAGIPFAPLQPYSVYLWIIGGIIALLGLILLLRDKLGHKHVSKERTFTRKASK